MLLREIALRERDPRLLESVSSAAPAWPGTGPRSPGASGRRLDGLRLPVKVFDAFRPAGRVVVARLGRSPARPGDRLGPRSGRPATAAVYRCTLVRRNGAGACCLARG